MHFPHLSLVDDWLEEGVVMGRQSEQPPVSEAAIIEGNHIHGFESVSILVIFLCYKTVHITNIS
jgi:hypothetical protein